MLILALHIRFTLVVADVIVFHAHTSLALTIASSPCLFGSVCLPFCVLLFSRSVLLFPPCYYANQVKIAKSQSRAPKSHYHIIDSSA